MAIAVRAGTPTAVLSKVRAIFVRDAKLALSYRANFLLTLAGTAISVTLAYFISLAAGPNTRLNFGVPGLSYFDYLAINMAFVRFQSTGLTSYAEVVRDNQTAGTLEVTLATPTGLPTIVLSAGLWAFTFSAVQAVIYVVVATFFGLNVSHVNLWALVVILLLTVISSSPLGIIAAAMAVTFNKTGPVDFVVSTTTWVFGGIYLPLTALPPFVQYVGWCLPVTHALGALRAAMHGNSLAETSGDVVWLSVATAVLLPISLWLFALSVRRAKIDGTLGHY